VCGEQLLDSPNGIGKNGWCVKDSTRQCNLDSTKTVVVLEDGAVADFCGKMSKEFCAS
jgi:hypothetical protein